MDENGQLLGSTGDLEDLFAQVVHSSPITYTVEEAREKWPDAFIPDDAFNISDITEEESKMNLFIRYSRAIPGEMFEGLPAYTITLERAQSRDFYALNSALNKQEPEPLKVELPAIETERSELVNGI